MSHPVSLGLGEPCNLELSGLTEPTERCGSCGHEAQAHRYWSRRPRVEAYAPKHVLDNPRPIPPPPPIRERAMVSVPSFVPATCENVERAVMRSAPTGIFVVALPEDVLEVAQAIHHACGIFWLNPDRSASRWKSKDAVQHVAAGCSHALQHMRGRVLDPDTGKPHLHLAAARMLLAVAQLAAGKGGV